MINRVFYGSAGIFASDSKGVMSDNFMHGVQSVSIEQSFDHALIPDIGRSVRGDYPYIRPVNNVNIDRVFTSFPDVFGFRLDQVPVSYETGLLLKPSNFGYSITGNDPTDIKQFDLKIAYNLDTESHLVQGANALDIIEYKRCLLASAAINMPKNGPFTESLSFSSFISNSIGVTIPTNSLPLFATKVYTRKDLDTTNSILPTEVLSNADFNEFVDGQEVLGLTNISVNLGLGYDQKPNIGEWGGAVVQNDANKWTTVNLPISVTSSFTITARRGQQFSVADAHDNFSVSQILLVINSAPSEYMVIDLGTKNIFKSVSMSGGDTSGGLAEYTFEYENFNNDFSMYLRTDANFSAAEQGVQIL